MAELTHLSLFSGIGGGIRGGHMQLVITHSTDTDMWIQEHHYLHSTPAGAVIRMEFHENEQRIGAMMWGRNTSPKQDQKNILCLTRM